jgi:signal transduction histidine kinase/tetratricopeptide (TPR) repeat protein
MRGLINKRYHIVRQLGKGGMGIVYLVEDAFHANRQLALKMINPHALKDNNLAQFKYEFSALRQLRHPNLLTVHDFDCAPNGRYFYTMDYIAGEDLSQLALKHRKQDRTLSNHQEYTWLYNIVVQICRALQFLHTRGFIHHDVKPGNIRVTPDGCAVLMDCGLIGEARVEGLIKIRGTTEYIAPELIRGLPVDHRVDMYSLGVSLYEIATHRLPFTGDSSLMILRQHVEDEPEPPRRFVKDIPEGLQNLILKLMEKEPSLRLESAEKVIHAINEFTPGVKYPVETRQTKLGYINSGKLVGRDFEMTRLQGLLMRMLQGEGRLVLVSGPSGCGKTRLINELKLQAQLRRVLVCEGACQEHLRSPYLPWVSILEKLVSGGYSKATKKLSAEAGLLARIVPGFSEKSDLPIELPNQYQDQKSILEAVTRFLNHYDRPVMLILEDLQYADSETIEMLQHIGEWAHQSRLLVFGVFRDDELNAAHPLKILLSHAHLVDQESFHQVSSAPAIELLTLDVLDRREVGEFVRSMLGIPESVTKGQDLPSNLERLLPRLMEQSGGNPLFIESIMRSLVDADLLHYDGCSWKIDIHRLTEIPSDIQEIARRRLAYIRPKNLDLLQWASVLGTRIDLELLQSVAKAPREEVFEILSNATAANYLFLQRQPDGQSYYRFSSDALRQAVYQSLAPEECADRHRMIALVLHKNPEIEEMPALLAWHYEKAGELELALEFTRLAALKSWQIYANETAVTHLTHALDIVHNNPSLANLEFIFEMLDRREECRRRIGDRKGQQADLERMDQLALEMGDIARQIDVINRRVSLATLLGKHSLALEIAKNGLEQARHMGSRKLEADCLVSLSETSNWMEDTEAILAYSKEALRIYREINDQHGEANSLRLLGLAVRRQEKLGQSRLYWQQALTIFRAIGNRVGEADILNALGVIENNFANKRSLYEQTLKIVEGMGDRYRLARAYNNLGLLYYNLGLYSKARNYLELAIHIQRETMGRGSMVFSLESLGRVYLELGEYKLARQILEEGLLLAQDTRSHLIESLYLLALGRLSLAENHLEDARRLVSTACDLQGRLSATIYLSTSYAWLGYINLLLEDRQEALRCTGEAVHYLETSGSTGSFPAQDVWWLRRQTLKDLPEAAINGDNSPYNPDAGQSLQLAHDAMLSAIATLSDEGLRRNYLNRIKINRDILTEWARLSTKTTQEIEPELLSASEEARLTASELQQVKDKFKRVLDISLRMNETRDVSVLLDYVMDQVIELSGAERGFLVLFDNSGRMNFKVTRGMEETELERTKTQLSYTVLGAVSKSKQPVLLQDALADEHFGRQSSVLDLHLRSVLCVPLLSHSDLIGAIYADNRSISGRFSQSDLDLLTIFASQAATAIENAQLHEETLRVNRELEQWAQTLEQRVGDRTSELRRRSRQLQTANSILTQRALQLRTSSQVSHQVTSILELDKLLPEVVRLIQSQFGYYFVGVWLLNDSEDFVDLGAGATTDNIQIPNISLPVDGESVVAKVCTSGEDYFVGSVSDLSEDVRMPALPATGSELVLPLRMGQRTIGALDIHNLQPTIFEAEDRMVLQTLADQIAIAIRNAQLFKKEQLRRQVAEALESSGRQITSSLDMKEVPGLVLDQLAEVVPYERGAIWLQQMDHLISVAQRGFPDDERVRDMQIPVREGDVYRQVVESRRPVLVSDVTREEGWRQVEWLPLNESWMGVPLITKDRVIGMISLTRNGIDAFTQLDAGRATSFAIHAAIALENASLYEAITRFKEDLERKVDERTEELNRAYHILERLDRAKSDFIDIVAHELRTPLTSINGYGHLLLENHVAAGDSDLMVLAKGIIKGAYSMQEIVNSMLDVAQIDNQTLDMRRDWVSLDKLVSDVVTEFEPVANERRLVIDLEGMKGLPPIKLDADLFYKVFYQLIVNAIKYTPDGGQISLRGKVIQPNGVPSDYELVVSDSGIGIAPEEQAAIFEKFYQTGRVSFHSSGKTKYKGGGPGLGLAIARGIVLAHGGQIWVESQGYAENECPGSQFYIRVPYIS